VGKLLLSKAFSIQKQLHIRRIGADSHIDQLSLIEIPVREHMYHGSSFVIRPRRLPDIEGILRKARRVYLPKIGVLCMVGGRLSDIVETGPEKLAHRKLHITVLCHALLQ
jgi:hypothetical protein